MKKPATPVVPVPRYVLPAVLIGLTAIFGHTALEFVEETYSYNQVRVPFTMIDKNGKSLNVLAVIPHWGHGDCFLERMPRATNTVMQKYSFADLAALPDKMLTFRREVAYALRSDLQASSACPRTYTAGPHFAYHPNN